MSECCEMTRARHNVIRMSEAYVVPSSEMGTGDSPEPDYLSRHASMVGTRGMGHVLPSTIASGSITVWIDNMSF